MPTVLILCIAIGTNPCAVRDRIEMPSYEQCEKAVKFYEQNRRITAYCAPASPSTPELRNRMAL